MIRTTRRRPGVLQPVGSHRAQAHQTFYSVYSKRGPIAIIWRLALDYS